MKELEKIVDSNGEPLEIVDAEAREDISEIKQSLSDLETLEKTASGAIATFDDGNDLPMPKLKVAIEPQQEGSGDPSPTNIRPISGWSAVDVNVCGGNVWDEEWEVGLISATTGQPITGTGVRSKNFTKCLSASNYYISCPSGSYLMWYDKNKNFISPSSFTQSRVITTPSNANYFKVRIDGSSTYRNNFSFNYPSTDTEYHAYNGATYTIDLDGTRYGGKVDVVSGIMTVKRVGVDMATLNWTNSSSNHRSYCYDIKNLIKIPSSQSAKSGCIAEKYFEIPSTGSLIDGEFAVAKNGDLIFYYDGVNPPSGKLVYPLATPLTIQLTPTQVNSLLGVNNIWADSGDLELTYFVNNSLVQAIYDMVNVLTS